MAEKLKIFWNKIRLFISLEVRLLPYVSHLIELAHFRLLIGGSLRVTLVDTLAVFASKKLGVYACTQTSQVGKLYLPNIL